MPPQPQPPPAPSSSSSSSTPPRPPTATTTTSTSNPRGRRMRQFPTSWRIPLPSFGGGGGGKTTTSRSSSSSSPRRINNVQQQQKQKQVQPPGQGQGQPQGGHTQQSSSRRRPSWTEDVGSSNNSNNNKNNKSDPPNSAATATVKNVDEALMALASIHTFDHEFPCRWDTSYSDDGHNNDNDDDGHDGILNRQRHRWMREEQRRSVELMKELNYSYYNTDDDNDNGGDMVGHNNNNNDAAAVTTSTSSKSFSFRLTKEEELSLLARAGSVWGQQEYQFATFPMNNDDDDDDHDGGSGGDNQKHVEQEDHELQKHHHQHHHRHVQKQQHSTTTTTAAAAAAAATTTTARHVIDPFLTVPELSHGTAGRERADGGHETTGTSAAAAAAAVTTLPQDDSSFERFWTDAISAPTPTPSQLSSSYNSKSSTYATTPSSTTYVSTIVTSSNETTTDNNNENKTNHNNDHDDDDHDGHVDDNLHSDENSNDQKEKISSTDAVADHEGGGDDDDDDDHDFGDFQEATPTCNDSAAVVPASTADPDNGGNDGQHSDAITAREEKKQDDHTNVNLHVSHDDIDKEDEEDTDDPTSIPPVATITTGIPTSEIIILSQVAAEAAAIAAQEQFNGSSGMFRAASSPFPLAHGDLITHRHDTDQTHKPDTDQTHKHDTDQTHKQSPNHKSETLSDPYPKDVNIIATPNTSMIDDDGAGEQDQPTFSRTPRSEQTNNSSGFHTPHDTPRHMYSNDSNGFGQRLEPPTPVTENRSNSKPYRPRQVEDGEEDESPYDIGRGEDDEEDIGMDAFVSMVAMVQRDYDLSPTRADRTMDGGIHHGDDDGTEDASDDSGSFQSRSIPSVVQLFTSSPEAANAASAAAAAAAVATAAASSEPSSMQNSPFVVPRTVRLVNAGTEFGEMAMEPSPAKAAISFGADISSDSRPSSARATTTPFSPPSASRIGMIPTLRSSFYSFNTRRNLDNTYNTPALVEQFEKTHRMHVDQSSISGSNRSVGQSDGGVDNRSLSSSIASPEAKFLRRRKSKPLIRNSKHDSRHQRRPSHQSSIGDVSDRLESEDMKEGSGESSQSDLDEEENRSLGSIGSVPEQYWRYPESDPTIQELKRLEWEWLPYWQMDRLTDERMPDGSPINADNVPLLQEEIAERLSKLDSLYAKVCHKAYRRIQPHTEALDRANQLTLDLQRNIQLMQMYLTKSQNAIRQAYFGTEGTHPIHSRAAATDIENGQIVEGLGVLGSVKLLELWDTQCAYATLKGVVDEVSGLYDFEQLILRRIDQYDTWQDNSTVVCHDILKQIDTLAAKLEVEPATQITCIGELRTRVRDLLPVTLTSRLHSVLEDTVMQLCFFEKESCRTSSTYSRLVQTMLLVHLKAGRRNDEEGIRSFVESFCTTVQTTLLLETQKALGLALLDPVGYEDQNTSYAQELLASRHNQQYLDATRIPSWTNNLVTIRFDLELQQHDHHTDRRHPLPAVFHKICCVLAEVLHGMHRIITWRPQNDEEFCSAFGGPKEFASGCVNAISEQLNDRRASIWNACIQALENCLDEWLKHVGKVPLFQRLDSGHDDTNWFLDLDSLQRVSTLTNEFLSLESDFLQGVSKAAINDGSMVHDKLLTLCKKHVRTVHVEAMNNTGGRLYNESWQLKPMSDSTEFSNQKGQQLNHMLTTVSSILSDSRMKITASQGTESSTSPHLGLTGTMNPFENPIDCEDLQTLAEEFVTADLDTSNAGLARIQALFEILTSSQRRSLEAVATDSLLKGVLPWISRILLIMSYLPPMIEDATDVMKNVFDLYMTTVFRLCVGSAASEKVLLGLTGDVNSIQKSAGRSSSPMFGLGMRSQPSLSRDAPVVSAQVEAELCALTIDEMDGLSSLSFVLVNGQRDLQKIARLDYVDNWVPDPPVTDDAEEVAFASASASVLAKRQAAAWSCLLVAVATHIVNERFGDQCSKLQSYCEQVVNGIPVMITLCQRMTCMRCIRGKALVSEIISLGPTWEENNLHERRNDYVDFMCEFMSLVWSSLCDGVGTHHDGDQNGSPEILPRGILKGIWETLVGCGYMVLLDGFARVPFCSTEGRSLMSMDLRSYTNGIRSQSVGRRLEKYQSDDKSAPWLLDESQIHPFRNSPYVDTYVRIFYFPPSDALNWILENYKQYHSQHMISLLRGSFYSNNGSGSSSNSPSELQTMIDDVLRCYNAALKNSNNVHGVTNNEIRDESVRGVNEKGQGQEQKKNRVAVATQRV